MSSGPARAAEFGATAPAASVATWPAALGALVDTSDFPPRWRCGTWTPLHGWLHIIADIAIWGAYASIPVVLVYYIRRRRDFLFPRVAWLFALFILACGTGHLIEACIFWWPAYRLSALVKVVTAVVSWATVIALLPIIPRALALPGLKSVNNKLRAELERRRRTEAALQRRNEELDEFTFAASHDLQEPLRKLMSFGQLLPRDLGRDLPEKAAIDLRFMTEAAARMHLLVNNLLELSRSGRSALDPAPVALDDCADTALDALSTRIAESGAVIARDELPRVQGNSTLLAQLYQNLIGNALKFQPRGQRPRVHLTAGRADGEWVLGVRDNGLGIKPEYTRRIFEPCKRLHSQQEFEGSGLGLTICRKVVERHGGRIWVESEPGRGSHFRFTLPAVAASAEAGADGEPATAELAAAGALNASHGFIVR